MSDSENHKGDETQTLIALALLQQSVTTILTRLDEQARTSATQAAALTLEFKHSIRNAEAKWQADLQGRSAVNDQKLLAINSRIDTINTDIAKKASQSDFNIVRSIVFGLVALMLVTTGTAIVKGVIAHEAKPVAAQVSTVATASQAG